MQVKLPPLPLRAPFLIAFFLTTSLLWQQAICNALLNAKTRYRLHGFNGGTVVTSPLWWPVVTNEHWETNNGALVKLMR